MLSLARCPISLCLSGALLRLCINGYYALEWYYWLSPFALAIS
jgi:hypothetical protein